MARERETPGGISGPTILRNQIFFVSGSTELVILGFRPRNFPPKPAIRQRFIWSRVQVASTSKNIATHAEHPFC